MSLDLDTRVRLHIFETFADRGSPPSTAETAEVMEISEADAGDAYRRLSDGHVIVLEPGSLDVWLAFPFSARPTPFEVRATDGQQWHGVCAWDAPGVLAMVESDGTVSSRCPDCEEPLELAVESGELKGPKGAVAHFLVPAKSFWDDIGFT